VPLNVDFLLAVDEYIRGSNLGHISDGSGLQQVAHDTGLASLQDPWSAARWTGELVELGYIKHSPPGRGDRRPMPEGGYADSDLYRFSNYRLTDAGHQAVERERLRRRQDVSDAVMRSAFPGLAPDRVDEQRKRAIAEPLRRLRAALDNEHWFDVVGASKDLVEAACKATIELAGLTPTPKADLQVLAKQAQRARGDDEATPLSRSVIATVQRLGELRNELGAGHGHSELPELAPRAGKLAASSGCAVAAYLLATD
jgi:Abortive infection C-terminus